MVKSTLEFRKHIRRNFEGYLNNVEFWRDLANGKCSDEYFIEWIFTEEFLARLYLKDKMFINFSEKLLSKGINVLNIRCFRIKLLSCSLLPDFIDLLITFGMPFNITLWYKYNNTNDTKDKNKFWHQFLNRCDKIAKKKPDILEKLSKLVPQESEFFPEILFLIDKHRNLSKLSKNLNLNLSKLEIGFYEFLYTESGKIKKVIIYFNGNINDFIRELCKYFSIDDLEKGLQVINGCQFNKPYISKEQKSNGLVELLIEINGILKKVVIEKNNLSKFKHFAVHEIEYCNIPVSLDIPIYEIEISISGQRKTYYLRPDEKGNLDIKSLIMTYNLTGIDDIIIRPSTYNKKYFRHAPKNVLDDDIFASNPEHIFTGKRSGGDQGLALDLIENKPDIKHLEDANCKKAARDIIVFVIKKYFPDATEVEIHSLVEAFTNNGCEYTALANMFYDYIKKMGIGGEMFFKETFGFDFQIYNFYNIEAFAVLLFIEYHKFVCGFDDIDSIVKCATALQIARTNNFLKFLSNKYQFKFNMTHGDFEGNNFLSFFASPEHFQYFLLECTGYEYYDTTSHVNVNRHGVLLLDYMTDGRLLVTSWGKQYEAFKKSDVDMNISGIKLSWRNLLLRSDTIQDFINSFDEEEKFNQQLIKLANISDNNLPFGFDNVLEFELLLVEALLSSRKIGNLDYNDFVKLIAILMQNLINADGILYFISIINQYSPYEETYNDIFENSLFEHKLSLIDDINYYNLITKLAGAKIAFLCFQTFRNRFLGMKESYISLFASRNSEFLSDNINLLNPDEISYIQSSLPLSLQTLFAR